MGSGIKGNWSVTQRDDGTGGNLEVAETMKAKTLVVEETAVLPGVVIDNHVHDASAINSGTIDPERLPTTGGIKGNWSVTQRDDGTGGNLSVSGDIDFGGSLNGALPVATSESPGAVKVGTGMSIDEASSLSWVCRYAYDGGEDIWVGAGAFLCVDPLTIKIQPGEFGTHIGVSIKEGGGVEAVEGGIQLAVPTVKALLGLGSAAYTGQDSYSSADHQHTVTPVYSVPDSGIIALERNKASYVKTITGNTTIGFDATGLELDENDSATFELLLKMETYVYPVLFASNISWLNGEEPYFTEPNKSYLFAFRTYNGGQNWVGAYQGIF